MNGASISSVRREVFSMMGMIGGEVRTIDGSSADELAQGIKTSIIAERVFEEDAERAGLTGVEPGIRRDLTNDRHLGVSSALQAQARGRKPLEAVQPRTRADPPNNPS